MLKIINIDEARWVRIRRYWENRNRVAERFAGTPGSIPDTYERLVQTAITEDWDESSVVTQDQVWFPNGIPEHQGQLTVYGLKRRVGHICPHAFSATPYAWSRLADYWDGFNDGQRNPTCRAWVPLVEEIGVVLNVTQHARNRPT